MLTIDPTGAVLADTMEIDDWSPPWREKTETGLAHARGNFGNRDSSIAGILGPQPQSGRHRATELSEPSDLPSTDGRLRDRRTLFAMMRRPPRWP